MPYNNVTSFDLSEFVVDWSEFANAMSGDDIVLLHTSAPEPSAYGITTAVCPADRS